MTVWREIAGMELWFGWSATKAAWSRTFCAGPCVHHWALVTVERVRGRAAATVGVIVITTGGHPLSKIVRAAAQARSGLCEQAIGG
jgi:hypothetical protein